MKRWPLVLGLILSLGLNVGIVGTLVVKRVQARRLAELTAERAMPRLERIADRLGLSGEERSRFVEAQRRFLSTVRREGRLLERDRLELRRELTSPRPDRDRIEELVARTNERAERMDRAFTDNVLTVREILDGPAERRYVRFLAQIYGRERGARPPDRRRQRRR